MSVVSAICDAIATELTTNVTTLATANSTGNLNVRKYTPQALDLLERDGKKNLAVWPSQREPFTVTEPAQTGSHNHTQRYECLYWESSSEGDPAEADETKAATLLTLADAIIARFYVTANQVLASSSGQWRLWLESWTPDIGGTSGVRGVSFTLTAQVLYNFS